jgi:ABC-type multidrug transport system ATPase subunit
VSPLLSASSLRVDVDGSPALDGLSLATTGERVLVLGAARALFDAASGLRGVRRGELAVDGLSPRAAARDGRVACAPLDPPVPPRWTLMQYVTWSARLAGHSRTDGRRMADGALELMQLGSSAGARLGAASLSLRRATVLAAALATGAPALLLDDPLVALPDEAARSLARVIARALADRRSVVFAGRIALESPLALAADEALVIDRSEVVAQGAPAELAAAERTLALRVEGDVAAFASAVEGLGGRATVTPGVAPPVHVRVELGSVTPRDLLRVAAEAGAVIMELRPIGRAFA